MRLRLCRAGFGLLVCLILSACTEEREVMSVTVTPAKPVVFDNAFQYNCGLTDENNVNVVSVGAPWFAFFPTVKNNIDKTVTLINFTMTITSTSGQSSTCTISKTDLIGDDSGDDSSSFFFAELAPGQELALDQDCGTDGTFPLICSGTPAGVNDDDFIYSVDIEVNGWVGGSNSPEARASGSGSFTTQ